jgi:cyclopropane-fatty-acyl-phospholipid synthase
MEKKMKPTFLEKNCLALVHRQLQTIKKGSLTLTLPNQEQRTYGHSSATDPQHLHVHHYRFFTQLVFAGNIGLGESYTESDWDTPNLPHLLALFIHNMNDLKKSGLTHAWIKRRLHQLSHAINRNTKTGSRRNIQAHYDLGNDFYQLFLDAETLLYSSALFESPHQSLGDAQRAKIQNLIRLAGIKAHHHILEVGCGWGGFAIEAARTTGCKVTGLTISQAQYDLATQRIQEAELTEQIDIQLCDYRDAKGTYDRIVSIEMLEAVGHAYYGTYFSTLDRLLKPGGRIALQVITIPDQRYDAYRQNPDWIQKHIFPGGILPSLTELSKAMTKDSMLHIDHIENIGIHYAETLRRWRTACERQSEKLEQMGYDQPFQRKWIYYLAYCEAGFQTEFINDLHMILKRPVEDPC